MFIYYHTTPEFYACAKLFNEDDYGIISIEKIQLVLESSDDSKIYGKDEKEEHIMIRVLIYCVISVGIYYSTFIGAQQEMKHVKAVLFLEEKNTSIYDEFHFRPAFDIAVNKVNKLAREGLLPFNMSYTFYSTGTGCGQRGIKASALAATVLNNREADVIFGPLCNDETIGVADLAANWRIPMFAAFGNDVALLNKNRFKTYIRMSHTRDVVANFVSHLFRKFNWKACSIVWNRQSSSYHRELINSIEANLRTYFHDVATFEVKDFKSTKETMIAATREARSKC